MTPAQSAKMVSMQRHTDWQHIADVPANGDVVLTARIGFRWLDALIATDGEVTFSRP